MNRLPSYKKSSCCNSHCYFELGGPCWGETEIIDEFVGEDDFYEVHACAGHRLIASGDGGYIPSGLPEDMEKNDSGLGD